MRNRALFGFECEGMGAGLSITQAVLNKFDLDLHTARPSGGGKFLFLAFEGQSRPTAQDFKALVHGNSALVLESPHQDLVQSLLHLQTVPSGEITGMLVLESQSAMGLLSSAHDHLKISGTGLYQLDLGHGGHSSAIFACMSDVTNDLLAGVPCPPVVTRTYLGGLSPKWRKEFFV